MGFPIIGETLEFMRPHDAFQLPTFLTKKILRYGPVFRTSLFGAKVIISADMGLNMEVAKTNHAPGAKNGGLDVKETTSKILIECLAKKVMGDMEADAAKELTHCWRYFPRGWFRFSWNIPGNGVYRMLKARKQMMNLLKETVLKKRASGEQFEEFFKIIFEEIEGGSQTMSIEEAIEYIFTLFVLANETTPAVLVATVKLINDNPKVKQELRREHERIVRDKTEKDETDLTWEDYKSMTFTQMV
ncbi:hypothetical protein DY000_02039145, partial [Brassica cretica]